MLDKAKKALEAKEAEIKGKKWLAQVQDEAGQWKDFEGWKAAYEPKKEQKEKKEESEKSKAMKEKAKNKALDVAFEKLEDVLSKEIFKIMLETSAVLLGKAADMAKDPVLPKVLISLNAIVLSYRFDKPKKARKFAYIRKQATEELTETIHGFLPEKGPLQMSGDLQKLFGQQKENTRAMLMEKIDQFIATANSKIDEKGEEIEDKMDQINAISEQTSSKTKDVFGEEKIEKAKAQVGAEILAHTGISPSEKGGILPSRAIIQSEKDNMVAQFADLLKGMLLGKMEQLDTIVHRYIEDFLKTADAAIKLTGKFPGGKKKSVSELKEEMLTFVNKLYMNAQEAISGEIKKILGMMRQMIDSASTNSLDDDGWNEDD